MDVRTNEYPTEVIIGILLALCCAITVITLVVIGGALYMLRLANEMKRTEKPLYGPPFEPKYVKIQHLCNSYLQIQDTEAKNDCELVYFGFVADGVVRYQSQSGDNTWIKLQMLANGRLPFDFKDCYQIQLSDYVSPAVVVTKNCRNITGKSLLFVTNKGNEHCQQSRFKCAEIFNLGSDNPKHQNSSMSVGNYHSSASLAITGSIVVMPIKNKFKLKYRQKSNRFSVVDPEDNCIAFDIERTKIVMSNCEDEDCSNCIAHLT